MTKNFIIGKVNTHTRWRVHVCMLVLRGYLLLFFCECFKCSSKNVFVCEWILSIFPCVFFPSLFAHSRVLPTLAKTLSCLCRNFFYNLRYTRKRKLELWCIQPSIHPLVNQANIHPLGVCTLLHYVCGTHARIHTPIHLHTLITLDIP